VGWGKCPTVAGSSRPSESVGNWRRSHGQPAMDGRDSVLTYRSNRTITAIGLNAEWRSGK